MNETAKSHKPLAGGNHGANASRGLAFLCCLAALLLAAPAPKPAKIVLIAGPKDAAHPPGTHEYEKSVRLLEHCLNQSAKALNLVVETHFNGWPKDDGTLKDAVTVVLISSGSDRRAEDHPLLVGDRLAVLAKEMQRGCGLVTLHWATFFPKEKANATLLDWTGGHFDYESGPPPRRWASAIQTVTTTLKPEADSPICRGVRPFTIQEELYYRMRLKSGDAKLRPVLKAELPGEQEPQTVAWSLERQGGGRGFAFTGCHFFRNWENEDFRKVVLNAIVWTAGVEVPKQGMKSSVPSPTLSLPPSPRPAPSPHGGEGRGEGAESANPPAVSPDWTPRPATGKAEPWEKFTDKDWVDDRLSRMNTGPVWNGTIRYRHNGEAQLALRGTVIKLSPSGDIGLLFDRNQLRVAAVWTGGFLKHSDRRFGLLNTPTVAGDVIFGSPPSLDWANPDGNWSNPHPATAPLPKDWGEFGGIFLHGRQALLHYRIGSMEVVDAPSAFVHRESVGFLRSFRCGPSAREHKLHVSTLADRWLEPRAEGSVTTAYAVHSGRPFGGQDWAFRCWGDPSVQLVREGRRFVLRMPPSSSVRRFTVAWSPISLQKTAAEAARPPESWRWTADLPTADLDRLLEPGPRRWGEPLAAQGVRAADIAPYVVDTITVPFENRFKALFFLSGVDFLPDGRVACCTAHGDVWLVSAETDLMKVRWRRFATGLYQPLGLKVVEGKIIVHERGQLTRLHDLNNDGEADFYENFCDQWHTGPGEHSYDSCLETDPEGNFYFFKTGDAETPTGGTLLRASRDGKQAAVFATGFRHPMGLCCGPTGILTGADQEGNWMPATRIDEYRQGGFYGDMRTHHRNPKPKTFDQPLCWLPREVDNSAGGQAWIPEGQFGPLGGHLLHLSFGRCKPYLLLRQMKDGQTQGGAYDLGLKFLSGCMHARFNSRDGCLYVTGLTGWQTGAQEDGCLQRVRWTGQPMALPTKLRVTKSGIELAFNEPVAPAAVTPAAFDLEQWNYRWSGDYGSKHWSARKPDMEGHDPVPVAGADLSADGRTVRLKISDLKPVMQVKLRFGLKTAAGKPLQGVIHHTINFLE